MRQCTVISSAPPSPLSENRLGFASLMHSLAVAELQALIEEGVGRAEGGALYARAFSGVDAKCEGVGSAGYVVSHGRFGAHPLLYAQAQGPEKSKQVAPQRLALRFAHPFRPRLAWAWV